MLKSLKKKMKDQAGLTLIELLVVIVILGIIAAVAIPMVMSQQDSAKKNTNAQNLSVLQDASNRYYTMTGTYADSFDDLTSTSEHGPFIDAKPDVITFGTDCPTGVNFKISSTGKVTIGNDDGTVNKCYKE